MLPPVVTVIMPVWAGESALALDRSLRSLISQTLDRWECLVVADGPLTTALDVVLEGCSHDARVRVLRLTRGRGPAAARNAGVALARGRAVAILDADDWAEPERLALQWAVLDRQQAEVVGSWVRLVDPSGALLGERRAPLEDGAIKDCLWRVNPIPHSSVMMRTEIARSHPYRERLRYAEDYRLWIELSRSGVRFLVLPYCLVNYQVNPAAGRHGGGRHRGMSVVSNRLRALTLYPSSIAVSRFLPLVWDSTQQLARALKG